VNDIVRNRLMLDRRLLLLMMMLLLMMLMDASEQRCHSGRMVLRSWDWLMVMLHQGW